MTLPTAAERYTLTPDTLTGKNVALNGTIMQLGTRDTLPNMKGQSVGAGPITQKPASIMFLTISAAQNQACQK